MSPKWHELPHSIPLGFLTARQDVEDSRYDTDSSGKICRVLDGSAMRIESALFSSKEGLHVHGQALGVVSDNISNANTVGFKKSRIEFSDLMAEGGEGRRSTAEPA